MQFHRKRCKAMTIARKAPHPFFDAVREYHKSFQYLINNDAASSSRIFDLKVVKLIAIPFVFPVILHQLQEPLEPDHTPRVLQHVMARLLRPSRGSITIAIPDFRHCTSLFFSLHGCTSGSVWAGVVHARTTGCAGDARGHRCGGRRTGVASLFIVAKIKVPRWAVFVFV